MNYDDDDNDDDDNDDDESYRFISSLVYHETSSREK